MELTPLISCVSGAFFSRDVTTIPAQSTSKRYRTRVLRKMHAGEPSTSQKRVRRVFSWENVHVGDFPGSKITGFPVITRDGPSFLLYIMPFLKKIYSFST